MGRCLRCGAGNEWIEGRTARATTMTRDEVANLIEAAVSAEREACAQACEALQVNKSPDYYPGQAFDGACRTCAGEIRKRSNAKLT